MTTAAALLAAALTLDAVAFRRAAVVVAAVVAFYVAAVVAAAVAASAAAVAVAVVVVGVLLLVVDGAGVAPTSPGYLVRAVDAPRPVYGPTRRAMSRVTLAVADVVAAIGAAVESAGDATAAAPRAAIRFLAPTWDLDVDGIGREIDRLSDCLARATATRHRARAAHYAERIAALDAIRWGATLH